MKLADKLARLRMPGTPSASFSARAPEGAPGPLEEGVANTAHAADDVHRGAAASGDAEVERDEGCCSSPEPVELTRLSTIRSLRSRLEAMAKPAPAVTPTATRTPFYREPPPRVPAPHPPVVPGERVETALGPLYRVVVTHDEDHRHGTAEVALACRVCPHEVALLALDPTLASVDFSRALYIDTETTGLAGGTGTLPFLIGMAWFEGERLVVEQLLLSRPGLEGPMLARLAERLALASVIVSYNGKSFDWPLLRTRFILNRVAAPALPAHLDLLHCARRVYKSRLGSVRLIFLEQELMGFERIDDIPGELIPETYLGFLRGSTPGEALLPIVDHNRSDLIALPALLGEIARRFAGEHTRQDARDQLGIARVLARADARSDTRAEARSDTRADTVQRAIAFAHAAVEADARGELAATALFLVGELSLRKDDLQAALVAFVQSLDASVSAFDRARAHHALAKLYEHREKDCARALAHARETAAFEGDEASARRVARLEARRARRSAAPGKRERSNAAS
ncbi:MAG: Glutamate synthase large chain [Myxococcaceae bacterium]|nr:Glutamate synthase large chain [Myxococcaceae bacterium]